MEGRQYQKPLASAHGAGLPPDRPPLCEEDCRIDRTAESAPSEVLPLEVYGSTHLPRWGNCSSPDDGDMNSLSSDFIRDRWCAESSVEALNKAVFDGLARPDQVPLYACLVRPDLHGAAGELAPLSVVIDSAALWSATNRFICSTTFSPVCPVLQPHRRGTAATRGRDHPMGKAGARREPGAASG